MPDKFQPAKFAQTISTGIGATMVGVGALAFLFRNLVAACLLGIIGVILGNVALKIETEKFNKILAIIGTILSLIPMIYTMVMLMRK
jgi:hypothetical protein